MNYAGLTFERSARTDMQEFLTSTDNEEVYGEPKVHVGKSGEVKHYNSGGLRGTRITAGDIYTVQDMYVMIGGTLFHTTILRSSTRKDL